MPLEINKKLKDQLDRMKMLQEAQAKLKKPEIVPVPSISKPITPKK